MGVVAVPMLMASYRSQTIKVWGQGVLHEQSSFGAW